MKTVGAEPSKAEKRTSYPATCTVCVGSNDSKRFLHAVDNRVVGAVELPALGYDGLPAAIVHGPE